MATLFPLLSGFVRSRRTIEGPVTQAVFDHENAALTRFVADSKVCLVVDEASKGQRAFVNTIGQLFHPSCLQHPSSALLGCRALKPGEKCDNNFIQNVVKDTLTGLSISRHNLGAVMSDNVNYMKLALRSLRQSFAPGMLLIFCPCHILHLVAKAVVKQKQDPLLPLVCETLTAARACAMLTAVQSLGKGLFVPDWAETRYTFFMTLAVIFLNLRWGTICAAVNAVLNQWSEFRAAIAHLEQFDLPTYRTATVQKVLHTVYSICLTLSSPKCLFLPIGFS